MMETGNVPLTDHEGKLSDVHMPEHLRTVNFDPQVPLVSLFETALNQ